MGILKINAGFYAITKYQRDWKQKSSLQGDRGPHCPLSSLQERVNHREQEFDGQTVEVAQPGVHNGDVHLLRYAKRSHRERPQRAPVDRMIKKNSKEQRGSF